MINSTVFSIMCERTVNRNVSQSGVFFHPLRIYLHLLLLLVFLVVGQVDLIISVTTILLAHTGLMSAKESKRALRKMVKKRIDIFLKAVPPAVSPYEARKWHQESN